MWAQLNQEKLLLCPQICFVCQMVSVRIWISDYMYMYRPVGWGGGVRGVRTNPRSQSGGLLHSKKTPEENSCSSPSSCRSTCTCTRIARKLMHTHILYIRTV